MYGIDTKCAYQTAGQVKAAGTHSCLHSSSGLLSLEKEPHRGFRWVCIQKRPQLRGPDPPTEGAKSSASGAGSYAHCSKARLSPTWASTASRGCSVLLARGNAILHIYCYCLIVFSSLAFYCCLMLYSFCFSSWIRLLHSLHLSLGIFGK